MPIPNTKVNLASAIASGGGFTLLSPQPGDLLATPLGIAGAGSVAAAGDLNGDGFADLVVGTPGSDDKAVDAGRVFITLGHAVAGSSQDMSHGTPDVVVIDGVRAGDMAGFAVGSVSDLNGDGLAEILVGAPGMAVGAAADAGAGFVLWGQAVGAGNGIDLADPFAGDGKGYAIKGQVAGDMAGYAMVSVDDMNGDGRAEVIIGAPGQDAGGGDAGAVYVTWGRTVETPLSLNSVAAGVGGFRILGAEAGDAIGRVIGTLSDQGGDGRDEILIGSATAGGGAGAVWVVDGQATGATVNLGSLTSGYRILGQAGEGAGASVSRASDLNGDGLEDILIGTTSGNAAYLVYGQAGHTDVNLADVAAGTGGLRITGTNLAGMTVLGNVDLNRDGIEDLVIGTPHDAEGGTDAGAVYVVWGDQLYRPINLAEVAQGIGGAKIVGSAGSLTGSAIAVAGDQNGDGTADLAILSPGTGESLRILYTPATWGPDANVYGTSGADLLGEGYGGPLHAIGAGNDSVLGLGGNDTIETGAGNDTIEGGLGVDSLIGGTGDDTYVVDTIGDVVVEAAGEGIDTLRTALNASLGANVENLILTGLAENGFGNELDNQITGNVVANWLVGGAGNDTMTGGQGNDAYSVNSAGDVVVEATGGGTDTVRSTIDYTLGLNLENLILEGTALRGTGNGGLNAITGTAGNNVLDGGAGMDSLRGLGGDDAYYVDNALDQVFENAGEGNDTVYASADFTLRGWVETLVMTAPGHRGTGSDIDNTLIGSTGQDTLDGGVGNDLLQGGRGNDSYVVDSLGDQTVELTGGGRDTVTAALDWTLALNVEDLVLIGAAHSGTGNALGNRITGTALADTLNGAAGADTLIGGDGDDIYRVDNLRDTVVETAGGGNDSVISSVSHTLADGVETLTLTRGRLTGTGNAADNLLNGSTGADHLLGLAGDDTLDGGAGADTMEGGAGNDIYLIDNAGDLIIEGADGGIDVAIVTRAGIVVNGDVEIIRLGGTVHSLTGGTGDNTLEGSGGGDTLDGGAGNDHILAGAGDDVIEATSGHDTLSGGEGDDLYHVHGAAVEIEDFLGDDTLDGSDSASNDYIDLSGETECEIEHEIVHITPGGTTSGPLDVQFLQDLTGSFADDIATVRGLVPQLVAAIQAVQANAEFGVSSFVDKPISPFGATGEWVYEQELGLTADATALAGTYNGLTTLNGANSPESQLEALMQLALHAADVGFRANSARFVVLFTDAPFHVAGDGTAAGITTPNNGDAVIDGGGLGEDYPLIAQVAAALAAANIIPIFAIAGGFEATYQGLVTDLGRGAVVSLTMNSSNIVDAITAGMIAVTTTRIEDAISGSGDDTILGGVKDDELTGNAGGDRLEGRAGADVLVGGSGNDLLDGGAGNDTLSGGAGDDRAVFTGAMADYALAVTAAGVTVTDLRAGSPDGTDVLTGIETLAFSDGDQALAALLGAVVLDTLTTGADVLTVADTDNHLIHGGNGNDVLTGGQGFDTIFGDAGNDVLSGGLGDDRLVGGALADTLTGGAGADTFVFDLATDSSRSRPDLITDFTSGLDLVDLTAIDADALTAGDQAFAFIGSAAFGMHAGEMRLVTSTTGVARLMGDVNGDGVADLSISFNLTTGAAPALADMLL